MSKAGWRRIGAFLFVTLLFASTSAFAQVSVKLLPSSGADFDYFGESVAIDGNYAIVGSWLDDNSNGKDAGTARIYHRVGAAWEEQAVLLAADGEAGDQFGISVSISGDFAFVGAHRDDNENGPFAGAVYIFQRNGTSWEQQARLIAGEGAFEDQFGAAVAAKGNRLVVGATGVNQNRGAAYIYHQTGGDWLFINRVEASDGLQGDAFGHAVDIDGDYAVIGAHTADEAGFADAGAAYAFVFNGSQWVEQQRFASVNPIAEGAMGQSVAVSGAHAIIGASRETVEDQDKAGVAHVYVRDGSTWALQTSLEAFDHAEGDEFGYAVTMQGTYAVIGARWHRNNQGQKSGAAYLFKRSGTTWISEARLLSGDGDVGDQFGNAVGFSNEQVIVGARWDDNEIGRDAGAAYIFPVGGAGVPSLLSSVSALDFGAVSVGESSDRTFSVANIGTADLSISQAMIEGADARHFRLVQGATNTLLAPLANVDLTVAFSPQSPGTKNATLRIVSNGPRSPHLIQLSGGGAEGLQPGMAEILASRGKVESFFGSTVAVQGDYAIVGAEGQRQSEPGAAYIYKRTGDIWEQQIRIDATDGEAGDRFGSAVAISSTHVIIGAWNDDEARGAAYVFIKSGTAWIQQAKLIASDGEAGDHFGRSVAIEGDLAVVGAWQDDNDRGAAAGATYVYRLNGGSWQQRTKLIAVDGQQGDRFGSAVTLGGGRVLVGAANGGFFGEGAAYVFSSSGSVWNQDAKLSAAVAGLSDGFGTTLAIDGTTAVIGAPLHDNASFIDAGAAYVFEEENGQWVESAKLTASTGVSGFEFGSSVDIVAGEIVVGARGADNQQGALFINAETAGGWVERTILTAADGAPGDAFGSAMAFTGIDIIVGAPEQGNVNGDDAGAVYLFNRNGEAWTQKGRLLAVNSVIQPLFGSSVAISGDYAVVGAEGKTDDTGAAYVYHQTEAGWQQIADLVASDGMAGDRFGASAAIEGDYVLIGAPGHNSARGAVYVFQRGSEAWGEQAVLLASDGEAGDAFGASVALSGNLAAIGAPADDHARGANAGSAYIFVRNGSAWSQQARAFAEDGMADDGLGSSVDLENTTLVTGSPNEGLLQSGSVYIFEQSGSTWPQEARLEASDAASGDRFGEAVSMSDNYVVVGTPMQGGSKGVAYVYRRTSGTWSMQEVSKIEASDGAAGDLFGASVAISGDYALIGGRGIDDGNGAAYLFQLDGTDWLQQARLNPNTGSTGGQFGFSAALEGEQAVIGAPMISNGNGAEAGAAYLVSVSGSVVVVDIEEEPTHQVGFALEQNYPNPARDDTTIPYTVFEAGNVRVEVYDLLGRQVATLVDAVHAAGKYKVVFNTFSFSSGMYFYRLISDKSVATKQMHVVK